MVWYTMLYYDILCGILQHSMIWCYIIHYSTRLYYTILCYTILFYCILYHPVRGTCGCILISIYQTVYLGKLLGAWQIAILGSHVGSHIINSDNPVFFLMDIPVFGPCDSKNTWLSNIGNMGPNIRSQNGHISGHKPFPKWKLCKRVINL